MPQVPARGIRSGPDRYIVGTHNMLLGAFAVAQKHIRIQSPYFLPDQVLLGAINTAARRGIIVDIVIPGRNNLRLVNYAMTAQLDQVIRNSCRVSRARGHRSEEHTSELQSLMRNSYAVFCFKKQNN